MSEIDYSIVLDENERRKMLAEGYLPEVIDWHARERYNELREDFRWKNGILNHLYTPVPYFEFVAEVFPGLDKLMVVTSEQGYREMDVDELMEYQANRSDVYVVPASFINGYNSTVACRDIYALVIDIDKISPETLEAVATNGNLGGMTPMPTFIVNSGRGVHFYYVFDEPVPHYHCNRKILKGMYRQLCLTTKSNILAKTDWHAITQPFRLPGSQTRLDQIVTGWRSGEKWNVRTLAQRLGIECKDLDLQKRPVLSQQEYREARERYRLKQDQEGVTLPKKKKSTWRSSLEGKEGFYRSCLERCYKETREGSRYRSMCALVVVARKVVTIPKEQVEQDLLTLLVHYNKIGKRMRYSEVRKALRMYNDRALETTSATLEAWFGWNFYRDAAKRRAKLEQDPNRPKLTRAEILEDARAIRDIRMKRAGRKWDDNNGRKPGSGSKEQIVFDWRSSNPEGKPRECIEATGLSKNTVYKWWKTWAPAAEPVQTFDWRAELTAAVGMTMAELQAFLEQLKDDPEADNVILGGNDDWKLPKGLDKG